MTIKETSAVFPEWVSLSEIDAIRQKYEILREAMDERTKRLWAASEALELAGAG